MRICSRARVGMSAGSPANAAAYVATMPIQTIGRPAIVFAARHFGLRLQFTARLHCDRSVAAALNPLVIDAADGGSRAIFTSRPSIRPMSQTLFHLQFESAETGLDIGIAGGEPWIPHTCSEMTLPDTFCREVVYDVFQHLCA